MNVQTNKFNRLIILITLIQLMIISVPNFAFAQTPESTQKKGIDAALNKLGTIGKDTGFSKSENLPGGDLGIYTKIAMIINILLGLAGIIATILIIIAGTKWIMAGGNEEEVTKAKTTIKNSVIGIGIVLASYLIVNVAIKELVDIFAT